MPIIFCFSGLPRPIHHRRHEGDNRLAQRRVRHSHHERQLDAARAIIAATGADPPYPTVFAVMYGDAAAAQLGYDEQHWPEQYLTGREQYLRNLRRAAQIATVIGQW